MWSLIRLYIKVIQPFDLSTGEFDEYTEGNDAVGTKPYIYKYVVEYLTYDL